MGQILPREHLMPAGNVFTIALLTFITVISWVIYQHHEVSPSLARVVAVIETIQLGIISSVEQPILVLMLLTTITLLLWFAKVKKEANRLALTK